MIRDFFWGLKISVWGVRFPPRALKTSFALRWRFFRFGKHEILVVTSNEYKARVVRVYRST